MSMETKIYKAIVLAAGEGTRLRPFTLNIPKVLTPIRHGKPLVGYILSWLKFNNIYEVIINLHHLGDQIVEFLGNGSRFGMNVIYSREESLLGTAGGVKNIEHFLSNTFIVVNGDVLADFNLCNMIRYHHKKKAMATICTVKESKPSEVGIIEMNNTGRILSFVEKPLHVFREGILSNGGIYILERDLLKYIPKHRFSDFAYDTFPKLLELGLPVYGYVLKPDDYLIDIGTVDKYRKASKDVNAGRVKIIYPD